MWSDGPAACRISQVDIRLEDKPHPIDLEHRPAIEQHWQALLRANPALYDGAMLLCRSLELDGNCLAGISCRTGFASFLYWRDKLANTDEAFHVFSAAAMIGNDGRVIMGRMAAHTASAGKIYMPAGSIDEQDVRGNRLDFDAAMLRETYEETGIALDASQGDGSFLMVRSGRIVALIKEFRFDIPAQELVERITANLAIVEEDELSEILTFAPGEVDRAMPDIIQCYQRWRVGNERYPV